MENEMLFVKAQQTQSDKELIIRGIGYELEKLRGLKISKEDISKV